MNKPNPLDRIQSFASDILLRRDQRLREAAREGDIEKMQTLVAQGVDVNRIRISELPMISETPSTIEGTALHVAVLSGQAQAVRALVDMGADPNMQNAMKYTPLARWYRGHIEHLNGTGGTADDLTQEAVDAAATLVRLGGHCGEDYIKDYVTDLNPAVMATLENRVQSRAQFLEMQSKTMPSPSSNGRMGRL